MKEEDIKKLIDELFKYKFKKKYYSDSGSYDCFAIDEQTRAAIEGIIRGHLLESRDEIIGILEAKVFMYEQIIQKSNFAPMLINQNQE